MDKEQEQMTDQKIKPPPIRRPDSNWGGKREGAGRPSNEERRQRYFLILKYEALQKMMEKSIELMGSEKPADVDKGRMLWVEAKNLEAGLKELEQAEEEKEDEKELKELEELKDKNEIQFGPSPGWTKKYNELKEKGLLKEVKPDPNSLFGRVYLDKIKAKNEENVETKRNKEKSSPKN
jgi:hypothetical protein